MLSRDYAGEVCSCSREATHGRIHNGDELYACSSRSCAAKIVNDDDIKFRLEKTNQVKEGSLNLYRSFPEELMVTEEDGNTVLAKKELVLTIDYSEMEVVYASGSACAVFPLTTAGLAYAIETSNKKAA